MVTSQEYRHVPTGTLAVLAQRLAKVFASSSTWYRLVRVHRWRRPRTRVHPAKPKVGIRASKPNEYCHVDTTVIRLLDGTRACLHAVIDHFSGMILPWPVADRFEPANALAVLSDTSHQVTDASHPPTILANRSVENFNSSVEEHDTRLPHSAFREQTPHELYFGTKDSVPIEVDAARQEARQTRLEANRRATCPVCD